jgi:hypothetical protein
LILIIQLFETGQIQLLAVDPGNAAPTTPSAGSYCVQGKLRYKVYGDANGEK